jgi:hypothetical protein
MYDEDCCETQAVEYRTDTVQRSLSVTQIANGFLISFNQYVTGPAVVNGKYDYKDNINQQYFAASASEVGAHVEGLFA